MVIHCNKIEVLLNFIVLNDCLNYSAKKESCFITFMTVNK